jgi:putative inorganic carbon (hco3(-)) transporter
LALGAVMLVVTGGFAVNRSVSWEWSVQWMKMAIIFPLLIFGAVRDRKAFNAVLVAHMLGAFWWGWDAWNDPKREAGRLVGIGSGDTEDDNAAAAHLLTVLPFTLILLLTEKNKRIRIPALVAAPFVINTLILCNSRGAIVGVAAALMASVVLIRTGYRMRIAGAGVAVMVAFFALADQQFISRQQTTTQATDGSSQERLASWRGGMNLALDRPFGAGGRGFHLLSPIYIADIVANHDGELRAPHNTYVMVWCLNGGSPACSAIWRYMVRPSSCCNESRNGPRQRRPASSIGARYRSSSQSSRTWSHACSVTVSTLRLGTG